VHSRSRSPRLARSTVDLSHLDSKGPIVSEALLRLITPCTCPSQLATPLDALGCPAHREQAIESFAQLSEDIQRFNDWVANDDGFLPGDQVEWERTLSDLDALPYTDAA
jgi:hypothetical protein